MDFEYASQLISILSRYIHFILRNFIWSINDVENLTFLSIGRRTMFLDYKGLPRTDVCDFIGRDTRRRRKRDRGKVQGTGDEEVWVWKGQPFESFGGCVAPVDSGEYF